MEVFRYLFQMFNSKKALARQISLFSLAGLMVIFFNNFASSWTNLFFDNFYINPPSSRFVVRLSLSCAIFIFIYLTGYTYKLIGGVNSDGKFTLPDFNLEPFRVFVKMIPLVLAWIIYYFIMFFSGSFVLSKFSSSSNNYIFYSIMVCLLPFIFIIFSKFSMELKYKAEYFAFSSFIKVIDKTLGDVIFWFLEFLIPTVFAFTVIYFLFRYSVRIKSEIWLFGVKYFILCIGSYFAVLLNILYLAGLAKISYKTNPTQE